LEYIKEIAGTRLNFWYPFELNQRQKIDVVSKLIHHRWKSKPTVGQPKRNEKVEGRLKAKKLFKMQHITHMMKELSQDPELRNGQINVIRHIEETGPQWMCSSMKTFRDFIRFCFKRCDDVTDRSILTAFKMKDVRELTPNEKKGRLKFKEELELYYPQYTNCSFDVVNIYTWKKVLEEQVLPGITNRSEQNEITIPTPIITSADKETGEIMDKQEYDDLRGWLFHVIPMHPCEVHMSTMDSILIAMSKTMNKKHILWYVIDWWAMGFYNMNLTINPGQKSKRAQAYYKQLGGIPQLYLKNEGVEF